MNEKKMKEIAKSISEKVLTSEELTKEEAEFVSSYIVHKLGTSGFIFSKILSHLTGQEITTQKQLDDYFRVHLDNDALKDIMLTIKSNEFFESIIGGN